jgi:hypothetical protein
MCRQRTFRPCGRGRLCPRSRRRGGSAHAPAGWARCWGAGPERAGDAAGMRVRSRAAGRLSGSTDRGLPFAFPRACSVRAVRAAQSGASGARLGKRSCYRGREPGSSQAVVLRRVTRHMGSRAAANLMFRPMSIRSSPSTSSHATAALHSCHTPKWPSAFTSHSSISRRPPFFHGRANPSVSRPCGHPFTMHSLSFACSVAFVHTPALSLSLAG